MDFVEFVKRSYRDKQEVIQSAALQRLGRAIGRTLNISPLLESNDSSLEPFDALTLAWLADAHREYLTWMETAKSLRRHLATNNLAIPDGSLNIAKSPIELEALKRTASLCQRSGHKDYDAWVQAVESHLELWRTAVKLSLAHGSAVITMTTPKLEGANEYEPNVSGRAILSETPGDKWLAIRRGVKEDILEIKLEVPLKEIKRQVEVKLTSLGLVAEKMGADAVMSELIERDLEKTIIDLLDYTAESDALKSARTAYLNLLGAPPLQVEWILSCYVGQTNEPVGLALMDKKGDLQEQMVLPYDCDLIQPVKQMLEKIGQASIVLPVLRDDYQAISHLEQALAESSIIKVSPVAMAEAQRNLPFKDPISAAVILGRRVLKPGREWGRVDPLSLNLNEYSKEVDEEKLKTALAEAKLISSWDRRKKNQSTKKSATTVKLIRHSAAVKRLNPMVKTMRDLHPEMMVDGIVTNITRFGAFVNIGLPTEGMIHVSQLSVEFVDDPSQVVKVGQQVKARILEVIPEKERIALSLKPVLERPSRELGQSGDMSIGGRSARQAPKTRSAALADLDALFKK